MPGENDNETEQYTPPPGVYNGSGSIRTKTLQREQIISHLLKMKTNISMFDEMSTYQLDVKLSLLERQLELFEHIQMAVESLDESQITEDHRFVVEEAYFEIKSAILERLAVQRVNISDTTLSSTRVLPHSQHTPQHPHLPTLQLSKFSGNYKDWMDFYNMFCMLVHDNQDLSPISKFQYLKTCLTDSAARLIQSLEITAENYEHAMDLLRIRYDNKRQLFQSHLLEIFELQKVNKPSVLSLRLFIDKINASMRALESIASEKQIANGIILHLVVSKLDAESQAKWEDDISFSRDQGTLPTTLNIPSWNELACFLERRCKTLEIFDSSRPSSAKDQQQYSRATQQHNNRSFSSKTHTTSLVISSQQSKCIICDSSPSHSAFRCTKFIDMNVADRFKTVKRLKLCLNCLGTCHIANSCPSLNRCQHCSSAHHTLLHKETTTSSTKPSSTTISTTSNSCIEKLASPMSDTTISKPTPAVSLHASQENSLVILATAMVELCTSNGTSITGRALLDSCSQSNFITERIAQHLRLPRRKINMNICGIGGANSICAKYSGTVTAKSLTSGFAPTFDAVIISSISSCHPQRLINITKWNIPANIKLADDTFNIPGPVDLLMGVDLFWDLLMIGKIKVENQPNLIKNKIWLDRVRIS